MPLEIKQEKAQDLLRGARQMRERELIRETDFRVMVRHAMALDVSAKLQRHTQRQTSQIERFKMRANERLNKLRRVGDPKNE